MMSVEDRFAKARTEHMQSAQRLGVSNDLLDDDDAEEEEDIANIVMNGLFKSYADTYSNGLLAFLFWDASIVCVITIMRSAELVL